MSAFETILLTTDFSALSRRAVGPALSIAERFDSKVLVLYVVEDRLPPFVDEYTGISMEEILQAHTDRARREMERFVDQNLPGRDGVETLVVAGMPSTEVVRVAEERGVGLIVMATHGRGFVSHALFGSTTERVLRRSPCPVLTVCAGATE
jgi:nucleotide-binding universal stress UspA family protein